ncbi:hypothetical protein D3C74_50860 [compost metagenome]
MLKFLTALFKREDLTTEEHRAIVGALNSELEKVKEDADLTKIVMMIKTSTGMWLDTWGSWFGVTRYPGELDEDYRLRIIGSTNKPSGTIPAIIKAANQAADYSGTRTNIYEPHTNVARYSVSKFSGKDRYQDAVYYRYGTIELDTPYEITDQIRQTVEAVKAAGIKVYYNGRAEMEIDGDGVSFGEWLNARRTSNTLYIQPAVVRFLTGAIYSGQTGWSRKRSGRQNLWSAHDLSFDLSKVVFQRITGESPLLDPKDFIRLKPIPGYERKIGAKRSQNLGTFDGDKIHQYIVEDTYDPEAVTDELGEMSRTTWNLRPATRSHHAGRSGGEAVSGALNEKFTGKPYIIRPQVEVKFEHKPEVERTRQKTILTIEPRIRSDNEFNKSRRSGRQILYFDNLTPLSFDLGKVSAFRSFPVEVKQEDSHWKDFLYLREKEELPETGVRSKSRGCRSGLSAAEKQELFTPVTAVEVERYGINTQGSFAQSVIHLGLPVRSGDRGRRSGKFPMSGVQGDHSDNNVRPIVSQLAEGATVYEQQPIEVIISN